MKATTEEKAAKAAAPDDTRPENPEGESTPDKEDPTVPVIEARPTILRSRVKEYLKYTFSKEELAEQAQTMARAVAAKEQAEDKLKSIKKSVDSEIAAAEAEIRLCSEHLRSGYEFRNIECEQVIDYESVTCTIIRLDTGEEVSCRGLRDNERQMWLV